MAKDIIWEDGILKSKEEDELDKDLAEQLEWIQLPEEIEGALNKRTLEEIEEMLVRTFTIEAYRITSKKTYNRDFNNMLQVESTQDPQRSLAPI